jgi:hypothetical protein
MMEEMLGVHVRKLQADLLYLNNRPYKRFFIEWKEYLEDETSQEFKNEFKYIYTNFVIEDNDLI